MLQVLEVILRKTEGGNNEDRKQFPDKYFREGSKAATASDFVEFQEMYTRKEVYG